MPAHISRRALLGAALAAIPVSAFAQPRKTSTDETSTREIWKTYFNDRFGTSIEYPSRFKPGRPPDNNDGQSFTAGDGAQLAVWGSFNALEHDVAGLEAFLREDPKEGEKITYRAAGKNWLVLSGTRGDRLFYKRYLLSHRNEVENAFEISYPAALASAYDPIVARLSKSLRGGRGYQTEGAP
jgi:serine/threonine-protein kinase